MVLSPNIDIEMVPLPVSEEHSTGVEDLFDQVSIMESHITYSPEFGVVSSKTFPDGGRGDEVVSRKEVAMAISWAIGVLVDVSKADAVMVRVEVNKALTVIADIGASLAFTSPSQLLYERD